MREVQEALKHAGIDPGPIDGMWGRLTLAAIKKFQAQHGLDVDGIVGPRTADLLFGGKISPDGDNFPIPISLPWLQTAFNLIGTREKLGRRSEEAILGWAHDLDMLSYKDDDIPWCGLFVAHCVGSQLQDESLPNIPLRALAWKNFGISATLTLGAVMVFWRGSLTSKLGHVGFYWAEDDDAFHILGGNQSNAVSVTRIAKNRLVQARWPKTVPMISSITRVASRSGKVLSQNEVWTTRADTKIKSSVGRD